MKIALINISTCTFNKSSSEYTIIGCYLHGNQSEMIECFSQQFKSDLVFTLRLFVNKCGIQGSVARDTLGYALPLGLLR